MSHRKKILFIINPIAGKKRCPNLEDLINAYLPSDKFEIHIQKTEYAGHAKKIAAIAVENGFNIVAACGGDGTINEIASSLVHTETALAIIPLGSGNGLARHLRIPLNVAKALKNLNNAQMQFMDIGKINEAYFLSIAGIGYDAQVAHQFNAGTGRGFFPYLKSCIQEYFKFKPVTYCLNDGQKQIRKELLFMTFANASQWGFNVKVAPKASVKDGFLEVCCCKRIGFLHLVPFLIQLLTGRIDHSKRVEMMKIETAFVEQTDGKPFRFHVDGDALEPVHAIRVEVLKSALKIWSCSKGF
jgi:YegS/Rv2252/BmrU family lipid kinase